MVYSDPRLLKEVGDLNTTNFNNQKKRVEQGVTMVCLCFLRNS
jgi:hypothetical protein